jgi:hypothetical protein
MKKPSVDGRGLQVELTLIKETLLQALYSRIPSVFSSVALDTDR